MSPSLQDGYNGTRDAEILRLADVHCGHARIQSTPRAYDLLRRAGITRQIRGMFYSVPVSRDRLGRLQIATPYSVLN